MRALTRSLPVWEKSKQQGIWVIACIGIAQLHCKEQGQAGVFIDGVEETGEETQNGQIWQESEDGPWAEMGAVLLHHRELKTRACP